MADKKQLGAFWGHHALYFVETVSSNVTKIFEVPFQQQAQTRQEGAPFVPQGMPLSLPIKDHFNHQRITTTAIKLSLPTKDIIFRSFVIPWMQANEIKGVVEFEASKYVPFSLAELSYCFQSVLITENNTKRLRIIFIAIKKNILTNYTQVLEQSGLQVETIEPSPMSLIRLLTSRNLVPKDETFALVEKTDETGKIIIVDQGVPQFFREFHLKTTPSSSEEPDPNAAVLRLINEIRISLDYYSRQESQIQVKRLVLLTSINPGDLTQRLAEDITKPVLSISADSILGRNSPNEINYLNAFGCALAETTPSPTNFYLSSKKTSSKKFSAGPSPSLTTYKSTVLTSLICLSLLTFSVLSSQKTIRAPKSELAELHQKLGSFKDADIAALKTKNDKLKKQLENVKKIRVKSDMSFFLYSIPEFLPDGAWLESLALIYPPPMKGQGKTEAESLLNMDLTGYVYAKNTQEQFKRVNTLANNLKNNKKTSTYFKNIVVESLQTQKMGQHIVTFFKIKCR